VLNRGSPLGPRAILQPGNVARLSIVLLAGVALVFVFVPPLQTKFVSDTFGLYHLALTQSPADLAALFTPRAAHWYRPLTDIVFWLEVRAFGTEALGYHVVALAAHLVSTGLVLLLTERLSGSRKAAVVAALVFLANPHAQELLWDVADLHTVLSVPFALASLLAFVTGRRKGALLLAVIALGVDEAGLLAIATIALYELIVVLPSAGRRTLKLSLIRLVPFAFVGFAYIAVRVLGGSVYVENVPCRSARCLAQAASEYFSRSFVRPEVLLSLWSHRIIYVVLGLMIIGVLLLLTRPWTWKDRRTPTFVVAWWVVATSYFVLSLWPYVADRFLFVPDCALAVLIGVVLARAGDSRVEWSKVRRWASYAATGVLVAWIATGLWMLYGRGQLWINAGDQADSIVRGIHALLPDPPPDSVFIILDVPDETSPAIPPGNTGPYVFHNGLDRALQLAYNRDDITVGVVRGNSASAQAGALVFDIRDGVVVRLP
jgi:hypothetical protein